MNKIKGFLIIAFLSLPYFGNAQTEEFIFQSKVVDKVVAYNDEGDRLLETYKKARANKSIDTISIDREIKENVKKCFQVPQDYIAENPGSLYSLSALMILGTGSKNSPVQFTDLERLFNSLEDKVRNSAAGQAYALKLKSWPWINKLKNAAGTAVVKSSVSPKFVKENLAQVTDRKAEVRTPTALTSLLNSDELKTRLKAATLVVSMAYDLKEGEGIQVNPTTAFVIDESGICVTNYHVLHEYSSKEIYQSLSVMTVEGHSYPVTKILAYSESDDLVIFKIDTQGHKLLALPLGATVDKGTEIQVMSHPLQSFYQLTSGRITDYSTAALAGKPCLLMNITADFNIGSSGGPIVDDYGNVVGTVSRIDGGMKVGIPVDELRKLLILK